MCDVSIVEIKMERSKECNICSHNMDKKGIEEENNNKMYIYIERENVQNCAQEIK